jgi:hypothetical protein
MKGTQVTGGGAPAPGSRSVDELLRDAVGANDLPEVKALLIRGADPNYQPTSGDSLATLYHYEPTWNIAAKYGYEDVLVALMEAGGNPDLQERDETDEDGYTSNTALYTAVSRGMVSVALILLRYGADPNLVGSGLGYISTVTPLMRACENQSEELVVALLKAGADPNAELDRGETARDFWPEIDTILRRLEAKAMMGSRERLRLDSTNARLDPRSGEREYDLADLPQHVTDKIQFMLGARPNSAGRGLPFVHIVL